MNPGTFILGGGGGGGGGRGRGGRGRGGDQGAGGKGGGKGPRGGGKNAGACGPGSGGGCPNPSHGRGGGTSAGDPVDPVTGRVYTAKAVDLALGGMIPPLRIERSYSSETSDVDLGLGFGWSHSLAWAIEERRRTLRVLEPPRGADRGGDPRAGHAPSPMPCGVLRRHEGGYTLEAGGRAARLRRAAGEPVALSRIVDRLRQRDTARVRARAPVPRDRRGGPDGAGAPARGREDRRLRGGRRVGGRRVASVSHVYYDDRGDLVSARDAAGSEERYEYDEQHRLIRRREPGGLVAEFRYDDSGRCVRGVVPSRGQRRARPRRAGHAGRWRDEGQGLRHVKIDDYDHFVEVITSRAKRRIDGNHLDKVNRRRVGRRHCTPTRLTPRATCWRIGTRWGTRGATSETTGPAARRDGSDGREGPRMNTTSGASSRRCATPWAGSRATSGTREAMWWPSRTSSGRWSRSATTSAACSSRRRCRTAV